MHGRGLGGLVVGHAVHFHERRLQIALGVGLAVGGHARKAAGPFEQIGQARGSVHGEVVGLQAIHLGVQGVGGLGGGAEGQHAHERLAARGHGLEQVGDALGGRARVHFGGRLVGVGRAQVAFGYRLGILFDLIVESAQGVEAHRIIQCQIEKRGMVFHIIRPLNKCLHSALAHSER